MDIISLLRILSSYNKLLAIWTSVIVTLTPLGKNYSGTEMVGKSCSGFQTNILG